MEEEGEAASSACPPSHSPSPASRAPILTCAGENLGRWLSEWGRKSQSLGFESHSMDTCAVSPLEK